MRTISRIWKLANVPALYVPLLLVGLRRTPSALLASVLPPRRDRTEYPDGLDDKLLQQTSTEWPFWNCYA
jgi:hypothetical protein